MKIALRLVANLVVGALFMGAFLGIVGLLIQWGGPIFPIIVVAGFFACMALLLTVIGDLVIDAFKGRR